MGIPQCGHPQAPQSFGFELAQSGSSVNAIGLYKRTKDLGEKTQAFERALALASSFKELEYILEIIGGEDCAFRRLPQRELMRKVFDKADQIEALRGA